MTSVSFSLSVSLSLFFISSPSSFMYIYICIAYFNVTIDDNPFSRVISTRLRHTRHTYIFRFDYFILLLYYRDDSAQRMPEPKIFRLLVPHTNIPLWLWLFYLRIRVERLKSTHFDKRKYTRMYVNVLRIWNNSSDLLEQLLKTRRAS